MPSAFDPDAIWVDGLDVDKANIRDTATGLGKVKTELDDVIDNKAPSDAPTFTSLTTVAGVKVPTGTVTGTLTMADHGGGVFETGGNVTIPNEAGFTVALRGGGAHDVSAGGAAFSLAVGDWLSVIVWAVGTVEYVHQPAADVGTLATS